MRFLYLIPVKLVAVALYQYVTIFLIHVIIYKAKTADCTLIYWYRLRLHLMHKNYNKQEAFITLIS